MVASVRGLYSIASRGNGPRPDIMKQVDPVVNMPVNSAIMGVLLVSFWLMYFYGANLTEGWFGPFCFDSSELPVITIYGMYIPMFLMIMKKEKDWNVFNRFIMPALSVCGCLIMVIAAIFAHRMAVVYYLVIFAAGMLIGLYCDKTKKNKAA